LGRFAPIFPTSKISHKLLDTIEGAELEANFLEKKDALIGVLINAQIDNAHILFSDARLQLYPQILNSSANSSGWEVELPMKSPDKRPHPRGKTSPGQEKRNFLSGPEWS
jgi:hypothetical protein